MQVKSGDIYRAIMSSSQGDKDGEASPGGAHGLSHFPKQCFLQVLRAFAITCGSNAGATADEGPSDGPEGDDDNDNLGSGAVK
eukprot:2792048-Amphidinium_carterae.1